MILRSGHILGKRDNRHLVTCPLVVWLSFVTCASTVLQILQKVLFLDTVEGVSTTLRPYWSEVTTNRASVVQAQDDMLEIVPLGTSKGSGVKMLLDHLGVSAKEVC